MEKYDVIIIGAGVAGLASAINIQRAGKNAAIIEKSTPGGKLTGIDLIENYPGIKTIAGYELAIKILEQVTTPLLLEDVVEIIKKDEIFEVITLQNTYYSKSVIIATGTNNLTLGLKGEGPFIGRGISFCAACDGALYKGEKVLVFGSSKKAQEEAAYLANICQHVYLVNPKQQYLNNDLNVRLQQSGNVEMIYQQNIASLISDRQQISGVTLSDGREIAVKALFVYQGYAPQTDFLKHLDVLDDKGYVVVDQHFETKVTNLYAVGDCTALGVKQVASAIGMASICCSFLLKKV